MKWVELATIVFGLFCVGLSIVLSYRFSKVRHLGLAKALTWQLFGEGCVGLITVIFAITSWLNLYSALQPELVVIMRISIFTIASVTSLNLYKRVKELK